MNTAGYVGFNRFVGVFDTGTEVVVILATSVNRGKHFQRLPRQSLTLRPALVFLPFYCHSDIRM